MMIKRNILDLTENKYDMNTLKDHIYALNLLDILKTQKINANFAAKYILNKKYQLTKDEEKINMNLVLELQPHISRFELANELLEYDSDKDSFENFDVHIIKNE